MRSPRVCEPMFFDQSAQRQKGNGVVVEKGPHMQVQLGDVDARPVSNFDFAIRSLNRNRVCDLVDGASFFVTQG